MLDTLQIVFWSITYVLIIAGNIRSRAEKKVAIPYIVGALNVSWEFNAMIHSGFGFWGHYLWLGLDLAILVFAFISICSRRHRLLYLLLLLASAVSFYLVFQIETVNGMLISSFVLDLLIAAEYLLFSKKLSSHFRIPIAITKLLGDVFAGLFYSPMMKLIFIIAILVFILNAVYLA